MLFNAASADVARRYDGTNELELMAWFRQRYGTALPGPTGGYMFGILSEAEREVIERGIGTHVHDHLVDVVDGPAGPSMQLRSGGTIAVEPGTWMVNCTGYIRPQDRPYEPYVSPSGAVASINMTSWVASLSSFSAYFATHLLFREKLHTAPLYEIDGQSVLAVSKPAFACGFLVHSMHNLSVIADELPAKVFLQNGLDYDRWYPLPRRAAGMARFLATHRRDREQHRRTLDVISERFDVRCGPLQQAVS